MDDRRKDQAERIVKRYAHLIEMQTGKAVRPYRADGYVNMMNKYGTSKDTTEGYRFRAEPVVPDELLTMYYEGNGLFAKIIDTPAEESIKHGFTLESTKDQKIEDFYTEALDELDWEEMAMTAIRWARLFGGSIAVMMINDGRGIDEPLDWRNIRSIDDIRVYDRSVIQPDYQSMFSYDPRDPFRTRGSRLGMPEFYHVTSRTGTFTVHDSRCLVFQNGILPENTTNSIYQLWGIPEYVRINRAIRDAEVAHGSATKLLDRSVQAVYKMKDLAAELATEEGEDRVLRRLQTIDMARGLLNSITIDSEGEDYDFRQFQFSGVSDVIDSTCNFLSALTSIPQTILFGRSPAGMNATGDADLENWYNYLERIQKRMVKKNLRYLLSVIFQAGVRTGEVDEVPKIKVEFNPLWSLSDTEQADLDQKRAQTQFTRAQTAQLYIDKQVIDPSEVRAKLADSEEFDVENMLDEYDDEDLFPDEPAEGDPVSGDVGQNIFEQGQFADYAKGVDLKKATEDPSLLNREMLDKLSAKYAEGTSTEEHKKDPGGDGEAPAAAPAATKLPQDMSDEEKAKAQNADAGRYDTNWITANGTHIPLDDEGKVESGGPKKLQGKSFKSAKSEKATKGESSAKSGSWKERSDPKKPGEMSNGDKLATKEKRLAEIDENRSREQDAIREKHGSKIQRTSDIKNDASLTDAQKTQKLAELDIEFQQEWDELGRVAREAKAAREKVEQEYETIYDPSNDYEKIEGDHDYQKDGHQDVVNPEGLTQNCQRCAIAYEMRRRGYDVKASPGENDELAKVSNILKCFDKIDGTKIYCDTAEKMKDDICDTARQWGDGARGVMTLFGEEGFGHIVNVYVSKHSGVCIVDSQSGKSYSELYKTLDKYTEQRINNVYELTLYRTDNATLTEDVKKYASRR